ncbi:MAG: hypothetical protein JWN25_1055 [Verrucomicrobiales bacterium]|nr:hypothetical protein [Verrucomicrobiales bacterium]
MYSGVSAIAFLIAILPSTGETITPGMRPRVLVSSDIGGTDPDDYQSMIHLLFYADALDIEGLISSPWGAGRKEHILAVINRYELDFSQLQKHSPRYPTPDYLRSITKQGSIDSAGVRGFGKSTEGSNWIIEAAKRNDPRPLWILVWGGIDDLAQALHDDPTVKSKIHVYYVGGPNKKWATTAYNYIAQEHRELWMIEANSTYRGWFLGGDQSGEWGNTTFVKSHLKGHGALGDYFAGFLSGTIKMGDTPSVMYVLGKNPNDPSGDSWGGHFVRAWDRPFYQFHSPIYPTNLVEVFSIVEITYPSGVNPNEKQQSTLIVDQQDFPGFLQSDHQWHFFYSPKEPKTWSYVIHSSDPSLDGQKEALFLSFRPSNKSRSPPTATRTGGPMIPIQGWLKGSIRAPKPSINGARTT